MECYDPASTKDSTRLALEAENRMLRAEIRVAREAAEITSRLVVEQFEKTDAILTRFQDANTRLTESNDELSSLDEAQRNPGAPDRTQG